MCDDDTFFLHQTTGWHQVVSFSASCCRPGCRILFPGISTLKFLCLSHRRRVYRMTVVHVYLNREKCLPISRTRGMLKRGTRGRYPLCVWAAAVYVMWCYSRNSCFMYSLHFKKLQLSVCLSVCRCVSRFTSKNPCRQLFFFQGKKLLFMHNFQV